jgi:phosphate transport system permease protein
MIPVAPTLASTRAGRTRSLIPDPPPPEGAQGMTFRLRVRLLRDHFLVGLCVVALACAIVPLAWVLWEVVRVGATHLSVEFLTTLPQPPTRGGGGWANAIVGSGVVVGIAAAIGIPVGVGTGIYMSEYGENLLGRSARFLSEVMAGLPSIVAGIVAYGVIVVTMGRFSAFSGGVALSVLFVPIVAITTQEALRMIPRDQREASFALGVAEAPTTLRVVLPAAMGNVLTGIMIAVARVAGETAPLLFTAFNSRYWMEGIDQPTATLPVNIYAYAISPFEHWHNQAWAGALVLVVLVLVLNAAARTLWARRARFMRGE